MARFPKDEFIDRGIERAAILGGTPIRNKPFASHPVLGAEEKKQVLSVLKTGVLSGFVAKAGDYFFGGPKVRELESLFLKYFSIEHAVAMNSATSALHAALLAVGIEPGDEVLVPPYTMSASASAIVMCGALPVFVDIDPEYFCMDPKKAEALVSPRTKAMLVVHLFGHPADMDGLAEVAKRHNLKIIEDCAQSPGASTHGRYVGTLGNVGVFSLNQHKTITTGEGGVAVTRDAELALRMQLIRNHGEVVCDHIPEARDIPCLGWNYRMTELEASVGIAQFKKLNKLTKHRIMLAEYLTRQLSKISGLGLPRAKSGCSHVYFTYPIRYNAKKTGLPRELFVRALAAEGIGFAGGYVRPIYLEPMYQKKRIFKNSSFPFNLLSPDREENYQKGSCPVAECFYEKELVMTGLCRYPLTRRDMGDISNAIQKVLSQAKRLADKF